MWTFKLSITIGNRSFTVNFEPLARWLLPDWVAIRLGLPCPYDRYSADRKERARAARYERATRSASTTESLAGREPDRSSYSFRTLSIDREGRWFCCWSWWLFPKSLVDQVRARHEGIYCRDFNWYQKQLTWTLADDIEASSLSEAKEVIEEFLDFVDFTSAAWDWRYGGGYFHWRSLEDHSWKLVAFRDIEKTAKSGFWLVDERAAKGSGKSRGRPLISLSADLAMTAKTIGYGLSKQLREVESFLSSYEPSPMKRLALLRHYYPWVEQIENPSTDLRSLIKMAPSMAAPIIAGSGLGVSPNTIENRLR